MEPILTVFTTNQQSQMLFMPAGSHFRRFLPVRLFKLVKEFLGDEFMLIFSKRERKTTASRISSAGCHKTNN